VTAATAGGRPEPMDLSVVLPVYNGAAFVATSIGILKNFLERHAIEWEIVVVDDGSVDATRAAIAPLAGERVRLIFLDRNAGKFGALKAGMRIARGRCRVFTDADLPYELEAIPYIERLVNERGFHLVTGDRTLPGSEYTVRLTPIRAAATSAFSFLVRLLVTGGLFDTQCGLKGFRSDVADALFPLLLDNRFSGDVELLYIALKYNLEIKRIPVRLRQSGPSTVRLGTDAMRMLGRIGGLRRNWRRGRYASEALKRIADQAYWATE
jgi:dolichyl-phosphate beta-glucosyltransferase